MGIVVFLDATDVDGEADCQEYCEEDDKEEEIDWEIPQEPYVEELITNAPVYGFAHQRSGVLGRLQSELTDIIDLKDADSVPVHERRKLRREHEQEHFNEDHYL